MIGVLTWLCSAGSLGEIAKKKKREQGTKEGDKKLEELSSRVQRRSKLSAVYVGTISGTLPRKRRNKS